MTAAEPGAAAPPPRDSALEALGFAFGVLRKPGFLWAPILFSAFLALPFLWLPAFGQGIASPPGAGASQAEMRAYFDTFWQLFLPTMVAFLALAIVIGPVSGAVMNRLGLQYVDGESPRPFAPGIVNLAWRYFLQTLALFLLTLLGILAVALLGAISVAILGAGAGFLVTAILAGVLIVVVALRLGLAPILLLWGAGPIEAIDRSWALTRGHLGRVFRWFIVIGVLIAILSSAVSGVLGALFATVGLEMVGQIAAVIIVAPLGVMQAIGFIQLTRVLQNPIPPPAPPAAVPGWMRPAEQPPTEPPTAPPSATSPNDPPRDQGV